LLGVGPLNAASDIRVERTELAFKLPHQKARFGLLLPLSRPFFHAFRQHGSDLLQVLDFWDLRPRDPARQQHLPQPTDEGPPQIRLVRRFQPFDQRRDNIRDIFRRTTILQAKR
jgi:hypothetical protein